MKTPDGLASVSRRAFLQSSAALVATGAATRALAAERKGAALSADELRRIMDAPVLNLEAVKA
ncbi:MAG: hypothetical protein V4773_08080, partial [Verrucomicrobiota bacterium]